MTAALVLLVLVPGVVVCWLRRAWSTATSTAATVTMTTVTTTTVTTTTTTTTTVAVARLQFITLVVVVAGTIIAQVWRLLQVVAVAAVVVPLATTGLVVVARAMAMLITIDRRACLGALLLLQLAQLALEGIDPGILVVLDKDLDAAANLAAQLGNGNGEALLEGKERQAAGQGVPPHTVHGGADAPGVLRPERRSVPTPSLRAQFREDKLADPPCDGRPHARLARNRLLGCVHYQHKFLLLPAVFCREFPLERMPRVVEVVEQGENLPRERISDVKVLSASTG